MIWRRSLSRPGFTGLPAASHDSRDCPPFQARVVKPRISTFTPQRSSVRARMSAQVAATVIGRPRIEPELSSSSVTTVSRKLVSFSRLNDSACSGSMMMRGSRAGSSSPSSRSNSQARLCSAINRRGRPVVRHLGGQRLGGLRGGIRHVVAGRVSLVHAGLHVFGIGALAVLAGFLLAALLLAFLALLLGFGAAVLAH